jgi:hypothetical protein
MNNTRSEKPGLKQKAIREIKKLLAIFLYLAFFFCALATYSMLLLNEFHVRYWNYGLALINALVISKVILIGQMAHLGRKQEARPLLASAIYKAFLFSLLVFAFHVVEEVIKRLVHGEGFAPHDVRIDQLLGGAIIVFSTFIPLFLFMEFRRVLGEEKFDALLFKSGASPASDD